MLQLPNLVNRTGRSQKCLSSWLSFAPSGSQLKNRTKKIPKAFNITPHGASPPATTLRHSVGHSVGPPSSGSSGPSVSSPKAPTSSTPQRARRWVLIPTGGDRSMGPVFRFDEHGCRRHERPRTVIWDGCTGKHPASADAERPDPKRNQRAMSIQCEPVMFANPKQI